MFYRGRLDGSARVVLVGQEGAQDESLSHRSFTGGTGARMQHFLRHLGIDRSYLFLNSFVYPIFGQYDAALRPLAQDPRSPIVKHRNQIFDKAVIDGDAAAGRRRRHGGQGVDRDLDRVARRHCRLPPPRDGDARQHPGRGPRSSASSIPARPPAGSTASIKADFQRAIDHIKTWIAAEPDVAARRSRAWRAT